MEGKVSQKRESQATEWVVKVVWRGRALTPRRWGTVNEDIRLVPKTVQPGQEPKANQETVTN